ncbi:transposase family protein [Edaphobacter sp.]|uniref:transposase family protein n=1 Tax=Edaphobacter sp. TaxID=1934404 RepID=UPI0039C86B7B
MAPRTINPDPASLELSAVYSEADAITINLRTCRTRVPCPDCGQLTAQIHSWYQRSFADLPWQGLWTCSHDGCCWRIQGLQIRGPNGRAANSFARMRERSF